ncbi:MAG: hypothetical protein Kow0063_15320 [Anaerolineae bacterium]
MKKHHWLFVVLSALALVLVSCNISEYTAPGIFLPTGGLRTDTGKLVLHGTGLTGYEVRALVNGQVAGVAPVRSDGKWSLEITLPELGEHELILQTLDSKGTVVGQARPVTITAVAPAAKATPAPAGTTEAEAEAEETVAASEVSAPEIWFPVDGADVLTGELTLLGSGQPGSEIEVLNGSQVLGTTQVGADGEWSYTFEPTAGDYQFAVRPAAAATTPDTFVAVRVSDDKDSIDCWSNPGIDRGETFIVGTCDTMEDISKLKGIDLEELIAANPQVEDPNMIYPGQTVLLP